MPQVLKMPAINAVTIAGHLVADPYPIKGANDRAGSAFTIASNSYVKGKKPITTYVDVVCWGCIAESAKLKLRSGDAVLVSGSLKNHDKKSGTSTVMTLQVSAAFVQFLSRDDEPVEENAD